MRKDYEEMRQRAEIAYRVDQHGQAISTIKSTIINALISSLIALVGLVIFLTSFFYQHVECFSRLKGEVARICEPAINQIDENKKQRNQHQNKDGD